VTVVLVPLVSWPARAHVAEGGFWMPSLPNDRCWPKQPLEVQHKLRHVLSRDQINAPDRRKLQLHMILGGCLHQ
jgi:hypothetical protein